MATSTPNYNLRKPADSDFVTVVSDISGNMDIIDTQIKNRKDEVTALQGRATTLESRANGHDSDVSGLKNRATAVEARATALESRASSLESPAYIVMVGAAVATTTSGVRYSPVPLAEQEVSSGSTLQGTASTVKVLKPGLYHVDAMVDWNANTLGERILHVLKNGNKCGISSFLPSGVAGTADGGTHVQNCSGLLRVATNDLISLGIWQNSGGNLATDGASTGAYLHMFRVAD